MDAMKVKRIAIVTGATGGLGREFVRLLLKEKNIDEIWALARNEKKLGRLKEKFGKKVKYIPLIYRVFVRYNVLKKN